MLIKAVVTNEKGQFSFEVVILDEPKSDEVLVNITSSYLTNTADIVITQPWGTD